MQHPCNATPPMRSPRFIEPTETSGPVIWTVSVSRLTGLLADVIPEFDQRAHRAGQPRLCRGGGGHRPAPAPRALRRAGRRRLQRRLSAQPARIATGADPGHRIRSDGSAGARTPHRTAHRRGHPCHRRALIPRVSGQLRPGHRTSSLRHRRGRARLHRRPACQRHPGHRRHRHGDRFRRAGRLARGTAVFGRFGPRHSSTPSRWGAHPATITPPAAPAPDGYGAPTHCWATMLQSRRCASWCSCTPHIRAPC